MFGPDVKQTEQRQREFLLAQALTVKLLPGTFERHNCPRCKGINTLLVEKSKDGKQTAGCCSTTSCDMVWSDPPVNLNIKYGS